MRRRNLNQFTKLAVAFISVGLLPVIFISMYLSNRFQSETHSMMQNTYSQIAVYGAQNIDNMIERYNNISKTLYSYNPESGAITAASDGAGLARILKSAGGSELELLRKKSDILSFVQLICKSDSYIRSAALIERDGASHAYTRSSRYLSNYNLMLERYRHQDALSKKNKLFIIPTHTDDYYSGGNNRVFSVGRNYFDLSRAVIATDILSTLYIDVDIGAIDDLFSGTEVYQAAEILITDADGNLIYANPRHYADNGESSAKPEDFIEINETCRKASWKLSVLVDYKSATRSITNLVKLIYILAGAMVAVLLLLSLVYSGVFARPARNILRGIQQVESGNFGTQLSLKSRDEMGRLAEGFNYMTKQLEEYNKASLLSAIKWKEAELIALRAQINPHFLYNSLEIIRMNAVSNDDESTAELASLLAEQMRYTLERVGETVELNRELEITRGYFRFIDMRYDHSITFEILMDESLADVRVPGLMLQPVVENAVAHGLKPKGRGHVEIKIERERNDLVIRVTDDGVGMSGETVRGIVERLNSGKGGRMESDSLGLKNVHDRLRLKFGEPYGISISSRFQVGTSITIMMPLLEGGREDA